MISQKMEQLGRKRSVIREIFEYSKMRAAEIGAENICNFSLGNPSVPAPQKVTDTMIKLLKEGDTVMLHGYTSAQGDLGVRKAMAKSILDETGLDADPNLIYMTCGAAASLTITLTALIANEGEEVIVPAPFFPEYTVFIEKAGGKIVPVVSTAGDFKLDLEAIEKAINKNTKAILLNSPNNPTGAVLPAENLEALAKLLKIKEAEYGTEIYIISDEPYRKLVYGNERVPEPALYHDRAIICYSFSKTLSLPGDRIGYICVSPRMENAESVYAAICGAGRALGFVCAPTLLQFTVAECASDTSDLEVYRKHRDMLYNALTEMGYSVTYPDGAFYLFVKALEEDANAFCEKAKEFELLLVPSDDFGCTGYVRIAYCTDTKTIERSIPKFKQLMDCYK